MCVFVCFYVCVCMCMCRWIGVYEFLFSEFSWWAILVCLWMNVCVCICVLLCVGVCMCMCICMYVCLYVLAYGLTSFYFWLIDHSNIILTFKTLFYFILDTGIKAHVYYLFKLFYLGIDALYLLWMYTIRYSFLLIWFRV